MSDFWTSFFKDAGIPAASAKNYGSIFDDNRITKEMLLDLDKEILREMGIKVMGDVILILKYAKKLHTIEIKSRDNATPTTNRVVPIPHAAPEAMATVMATVATQQLPTVTTVAMSRIQPVVVQSQPTDTVVHPAVPITTSKGTVPMVWLPAKDSPEKEYTTAAYQEKLVQKEEEERKTISLPPYGTLHSDKLLYGDKSDGDRMILEEYTTATYEAKMKHKRVSSGVTPPSKAAKGSSSSSSSRVVVVPAGERKDDPLERSRRLLEAAGCYGVTEGDATLSSPPKASVFSRLGLNQDTPPITTPSGAVGIPVKQRLGQKVPPSPPQEPETPPTASMYSEKTQSGTVHLRLGPKVSEKPSVPEEPSRGTMVADNISQHSDVHARLKKQGITLVSNKNDPPLGNRLGSHAIFQRLE